MKDLQYYLGLLDEREATCLVLLDEKIIYESQEDRLKPLLAIISDRDLQEKVKGAVLVDRVIGKSAYGLASTLGFSHIYNFNRCAQESQKNPKLARIFIRAITTVECRQRH